MNMQIKNLSPSLRELAIKRTKEQPEGTSYNHKNKCDEDILELRVIDAFKWSGTPEAKDHPDGDMF